MLAVPQATQQPNKGDLLTLGLGKGLKRCPKIACLTRTWLPEGIWWIYHISIKKIKGNSMDNLNISNNNFNDNDNICNSNFATRDKAASTSSKIIIACVTNGITYVDCTSQNEIYLINCTRCFLYMFFIYVWIALKV